MRVPTPTLAPEPRRDARREVILDAALTLFSQRTFDGTPVPLIADTAGVGAGTIYRYFPSKEALVNALYRRGKTQMRHCLQEGLSGSATTRGQVRAMWQGLWRFAVDNPRAIAFLETHHHAAYLDDESLALAAAIDAEITAFVRRAQQAGDIRSGVEPSVLISLVMGAFNGLVRKAGPNGLTYDERTVAQTEEIIWSALSPPP